MLSLLFSATDHHGQYWGKKKGKEGDALLSAANFRASSTQIWSFVIASSVRLVTSLNLLEGAVMIQTVEAVKKNKMTVQVEMYSLIYLISDLPQTNWDFFSTTDL